MVAAVFANSVLSAGLFSSEKSQQAITSGLQEVQGTLELRGDVIGYRDTLNTGGKGSLGKVEFSATVYSGQDQIDLTPAYTIDQGTGAPINSAPGANKLQIAFNDDKISLPDCVWTVSWEGKGNGDNILDSGEKAIVTVWLHAFDGTNWVPMGGASPPFLGTNYLDAYHTFTLEIKPARGAITNITRTTPAYLDPVTDLR